MSAVQPRSNTATKRVPTDEHDPLHGPYRPTVRPPLRAETGQPVQSARRTHTPPRVMLQHSAHGNRRRHTGRRFARVVGLLALDTTGAVVALALTLSLHSVLGLGQPHWMTESGTTVVAVLQALTAVCGGLFLLGTYGPGNARRDASKLAAGVGLGTLFLHWPALWQGFDYALPSFGVDITAYVLTTLALRKLVDRIVSAYWPGERGPGRTLLIGSTAEVQAALDRCPLQGPAALRPVGQFDIASVLSSAGQPDDRILPSIIADREVDTVMLCGRLSDVELARIVRTADAAGCRVVSLSRAFSVAQLSPTLHWYGRTPVIELTRPGLRGRDLLLKRLFDIAASSLLLVALSPLLLLVALAVRLSSPGPVLFRQQRVGYAGRQFDIYKFRSMYVDAEARLAELQALSLYADGRLFKMQQDPRVTPVGRVLRRTSLDELPQLFNVLRGEMSLVGPRPPLLREVELYNDHEYTRFDMKPGITGPWQVSGRNRITSFEDVVRLEVAYFTGWTILRDFYILLRTIPVVLKMDGAH